MSHQCKFRTVSENYGVAADYCEEADGKLWIGNGEYRSQVNYCPYCGFKAAIEARQSKYCYECEIEYNEDECLICKRHDETKEVK